MSPADLSTELRRSAEATAESIRASARSEAQELRDEARRKIEKKLKDSLQREEAKLRAEARLAIATARHEAMRSLLLAKTRLVDRVMEKAQASLFAESRSEAYLEQLPSYLEEALRFAGEDEPVLVQCPSELLDAVQHSTQNRPSVRVEADPELQTGFVVVGQNGLLRVDKRLELALEEARTDLAIAIQARLEELADALLPG